MAWASATLLLIIVLAVSWHIHPKAPGLVLVMFSPIFFAGLGLMLGPTKGVIERLFGVLLVFGTGWVLLWGFSLVL